MQASGRKAPQSRPPRQWLAKRGAYAARLAGVGVCKVVVEVEEILPSATTVGLDIPRQMRVLVL